MNDRTRMAALAVLVLAVVALGAWFEVRGRQARHAPAPAVTQPAGDPAAAPTPAPAPQPQPREFNPDDELVG